MNPQAHERKLARTRAWRQKNQKKVRAYSRAYSCAYYKKNRQRLLARSRAYRQANPEKVFAKDRAYYHENRDTLVAQQRTHRQENHEKILVREAAYREKNRERIRTRMRGWHRENPEKVRSQRRAWYQKNRRQVIAETRKWRKKNLAKVRASASARYHDNRDAIAGKSRERYNAKRQYVAPEELEACRQDPRKAKSIAGLDFIVCLECGEKKWALGGHLKREHNLTAKEFRRKPGPDGKAPRYNVRTSLSSVNRLKRLSRACKRRRHGHWLPRSRPPLAKLNAARKRRGLSLEARLNISDKLKGKQHAYEWKKLPDGSVVTDFQIAQLRLQGKEILDISRRFGMTDMPVIARLRRMGFPRGRACLFQHGERIMGNFVNHLCQDFDKTKEEIAVLIGRPSSRVSHHSSGSRLRKPLPVSMTRALLAVQRTLTESYRKRSSGKMGGRPRVLLPSKKRTLPTKYRALRSDLKLLRQFLRDRDGKTDTAHVWNWLCEQSRRGSIRTLLFWPEFLDWIKSSYDGQTFLDGVWVPSDLAIQFLAENYRASVETVRRAVLAT